MVRNGEASHPWVSKEQLLKKHPGAYTTARTVDQTFVFELSMHCRRLCKTVLAVLEQDKSEKLSHGKSQALAFLKDEVAGAEKLKALVAKEITTALQWLGDDGSGREHQVTVLITCDSVGPHTPTDRGFDIFTFVQPMPTIAPMVDVQARHAKRKNPTIKDVQWVLDRQNLEELQRQAGVNEIIMFDEDGFVTEGLQSNFFAVTADGVVMTAPSEKVLAGTVRKVVLEVAQKQGIPLRQECPNIRDFANWESCFICSTSRLVKPIRRLQVPEYGESCGPKQFPTQGTVTHILEALVCEAVRENSEPLPS